MARLHDGDDPEAAAAADAAMHEAMNARGSNRCAIVRKKARRDYRKAQRKRRAALAEAVAAAAESSSDSEGASSGDLEHDMSAAGVAKRVAAAARRGVSKGEGWGGRAVPVVVLREVTLPAEREHFLPAPAHEALWDRAGDAAYHMGKLTEEGNPLAQRVTVWEKLEEQPEAPDALEESRTVEGAFVLRGHAGAGADPEAVAKAKADRLIPHGDPAAFRDVEALADRMDAYAGTETTYKLTSAKPPAIAPEHADCVVLYLTGDGSSKRVIGSVIYDSLGHARVDMNFQHHMMVHGSYNIKSGHWHILAPGDHTHAHGIENHFGFETCPWIWLAIPKEFGVIPNVPVGT